MERERGEKETERDGMREREDEDRIERETEKEVNRISESFCELNLCCPSTLPPFLSCPLHNFKFFLLPLSHNP